MQLRYQNYYHKNSHLKDYLDFTYELRHIIRNDEYEKLLEFTNFSICHLIRFNFLHHIMLYCDKKIIKHVFTNMISVTAEYKEGIFDGINLINILSTQPFIDKNIDHMRIKENCNLIRYLIDEYP